MKHPTTYVLTVEAGPAKVGETFALVGAASQTLGRSSNNPIAIPDPLLSREHCRFDTEGDALWVVDLDSANQTLVNGTVVKRQRLQAGDVVTVGDTRMRVVVAADTPAAQPGTPATPASATEAAAPVIDLGLGTTETTATTRHSLRPILYTVAAIVLLLLAVTFIMTAPDSAETASANIPSTLPADEPLQIIYEKIEASPESIFRYELTLSPDGRLAVRIDDLSQDRAVRQEKSVDPVLLRDWARTVQGSGFFNLDDAYLAAATADGARTSWDLTIILGQRVHRVRIANRPEPEAFAALREKLETFGQSELGIWAIQYSAEKLTDLAHDALLVARKRMDERDLRYGNIALAIANYRDAEVCLETVEPKPDFFPDIRRGLEEAKVELDRRHKEYRFLADRAINLQNWEDARTQLRVLCELIPDRSDNRHKDAAGKLLDVERRLQAARKKR